ncbi:MULTISPECIES: acyl carrier protein [Streptomyces]|uniref:acyl carrier protein n=1 Tax=Streptomyces TaxID=1883 RepID=UPI000F70306C|nr:acyl carrier protein [Streptomyces sp. W1SF4]AZM92179.1 acyl carrier protein [Streptomyces sp. W1SF4]
MYEKLLALLDEMGIDIAQATPQTTFRDLEMDSLSLTELAVNISDDTGVFADGEVRDMTLAQAAQRLMQAAEPQQA